MKITKIRQGKNKKQGRNSNIKTQPSETSDDLIGPNNIVIPFGAAVATISQGNSYAFKNSKPNLKQLYDYLKHQVIVIKQKQRIVTNKQSVSRFNSINQMHQKITQEICLRSEEDQQERQQKTNKNVNKICLPKIDRNVSLLNSHSIPKRKPQLHRFPKKTQANMSNISRRRLSSLDSRLHNIQNSPLLSYKYFERKKTEQSLKGQVLINRPQIINLRLFKQNPRISNLSLEVAMQVSRQNRKFMSQYH